MSELPSSLASASVFATTHWSVILTARENKNPAASAALEALCRTYWRPLYSFARRSGKDPDAAKDLTQGFFAFFLARDALLRADPGKGRFRSFLLASLKNYLTNEWHREKALKRGGGLDRLAWDDLISADSGEQQDTSLALTPEEVYDHRWALTVLEVVGCRLKEEYTMHGKVEIHEALGVYLSGEKGLPPYSQTAERLRITEAAARKSVERLRRRFGELLREEIANVLADPREIDDEIRHLRQVLARRL